MSNRRDRLTFASLYRSIVERDQALAHDQTVASLSFTTGKKQRDSTDASSSSTGNEGDILFNMLKTMNEMRERGEQCDVTIICEGGQLQAHKVVLASRSGYFRGMFDSSILEPHQKEISLPDISVDTMDQLLHHIYTTEHKLTTENAQNLLIAANFLQINDLPDICGKFIFQTLDLSNCVSMKQLLESTNCDRKMIDQITKFIKIHFQQIIQKESIMDLDVNALVDLLSIQGVVCDSEEYVCISAIKWLEAKPERKDHALRVLQSIRIGLLSETFINSQILNDPIFNRVISCLNQLSCKTISRSCNMSILAHTNASNSRIYNLEDQDWKHWNYVDLCRQMVFHGQYLFLVGPFQDAQNLYLKRYDCCTKEWKTIADTQLLNGSGPMIMIQNHETVVANNQLYIFVETETSSRCIKIFNITTSRWSNGPVMFKSPGPLAIVSLDDFVYVFETKNETGPLKAKKLNTTTQMWSDIAPIMKDREECGITVYNRKIYLAGGIQDKSPDSTFFEVYNPENDKWTELITPITPGNAKTTLVAVADGIYAFERITSVSLTSGLTSPKNKVNFYDVEKNIWIKKRKLPKVLGSNTIFCAVPEFMI